MLNRRNFIATSVAASSLGIANQAMAHAKGAKYVLPDEFMPREVRLKTKLEPGEIHVEPSVFALYWTLPKRKAIRYTCGIGRGNLYHSGTFHVGAKQEWPRWIPTDDMKERDPEAYEKFAEGEEFEDGMPGGIANPLGARALYLYTAGGRDTFLRIHGTSRPRTIGIAVSNGCARLVNDQVIELFDKVPMGTKVVLYEKQGAGPAHAELF